MKSFYSILLVLLISGTFASTSLLSKMNKEGFSIEYPDYGSFRPKVALVLSGGGARGISQVGAIEVLDSIGLPFDYVIGTSIGSIVGGLLASGYKAQELDSIITGIEWNKIFAIVENGDRNDLFIDQKVIEDRSAITLRFKNFKFVVPEAFSAGDEFNMVLQKYFWNSLYKPEGNFDNLKYKFRAVTTDLISGRSISQKSGSIISAVRASSTIPLRYTPVRRDSLILIDGGIFANVPVDAALEFNPDLIIAINTVSPLLQPSQLNTPWNIADQVVSISMERHSNEQLKKAHFVICPNIEDHKNNEFDHLDTLINQGKLAGIAQADRIMKQYLFLRDSILNSKYNGKLDDDFFEGKKIILKNFERTDSSFLANQLSGKLSLAKYNNILSLIMRVGRYQRVVAHFENDLIELSALPYMMLSSISLVGCEASLVRNYIQSLNDSLRGTFLSPENKTKIMESIIASYRREGYSYSSITSTRIDESGNLFLTVDEGVIHKIIISGNESTSRFLIQRELKFKEGQPVNADKIVRGWNNLKKTELFSSIEIFIDEDSYDKSNVLHVRVTEGGTQAIRIGGRVDNERYGQVGIDVIQENLFNAGLRVTGRLAVGNRNQDYSFLIDNPRIFKTQLSFSSVAYYSLRNVNQYMTKFNSTSDAFKRIKESEFAIERFGAKIGLGAQIDKNGIFGLEYRLEKQRYYNLDSQSTDFYNISTLNFSTRFDSENLSDFATSGQIIELSLETGLMNIKPSTSFSKAYLYYHNNFSIDDMTIRPSIMFGAADKTLPYPEFFSLGGENSFYGMREDEERGRQIFNASVEYRLKMPFKIFFDTYVTARYDLGAIWQTPETVRFENLKHGFGTSLQFNTPLGPAKFSIARSFYFVSDPNGIVRGKTLAYFSIGMRL